jgi:diguanylate cyclase (GGDEF)-like protein
MANCSTGSILLVDTSLYVAEVCVFNWSELPDLAAVGLLAGAFASVARRNQTNVSKIWLTGWLMIALHFLAALFGNATGTWGVLDNIVIIGALTWAGLLFMWASVPYRKETSSRWMFAALLIANTLYVALLIAGPFPPWAMYAGAALFAVLPLSVALSDVRKFDSPLRWTVVVLYCTLSVYLCLFQMRPDNGSDLALNGVLFTVYIGCCAHFWFAYKRATAGAFITIAGFLAWACVFLVAPLMQAYIPAQHVESEVWNLPKYLVAVGMILLLLEDQIEHNKHLALHDHLTGLPNRRLYQDRLANALERARRSEAQAALLVVDLDRFKQVNDSLGHHVGDLVLQRVAAMFSSRVRRSDTVARTGGDEFSIILEEPICRADAMLVGQSLIQLLDEPLEIGEHSIRIGASVGIAIYPEDAREMEPLCIAADLRMYDAKYESDENREQAAARASRRQSRLAVSKRADLQVVE